MSARLPYRPSPYPHEGLSGFLLRLAEGNGCNGIRTLIGDRPVTASRLATWLGRDESGFGQLVSQLNAKKAAPRPLWNNRSSRYCPACLKADPTWRQEWELTLLTVCPFHGHHLVEVCSGCERQITWSRMRLLSCDCGFRFQAACAAKATEAETALAATLYVKLTGRGRVPILVTLLSLEQLYQLIVALGAYSHVEHGKRPQKIANLGHLQVSEKLTRATAEILATWPAGFNALLDKLAHHPTPSQEIGLPRQFGFFYAYVFAWMNAPEFGFLLSAFEKYIAKHWPHPLNERNKRMSPELRSTSVWIPASVAAKELGTTRKRLLLLVEAGMIRLNSRKTASGRTVLCAERSGLPAIRLVLADLMDHRTASAILNITKGRMYQLLHYNVVRTIVVPRRWGAGAWGISMKSLQSVLLAGDGLPSVESVGRNEVVTMDYALRHLLKRQYLFPLLVEAAIKKEIVPIAVLRDVPGIAGWIFDHDQIKCWIADRIQGKRQGMLTIPEAAARLGLKQQAVYHFVSKGLIRVDYDPDSSAALVSENELRRFQEEYVLGREIGERLGTSASQAVRMLQKQEGQAICGKTVDGCSQYLYRRDDRLEEALSKLEQKMGDPKLHIPKDMEAWLEMRDVRKEII